MRAARLVRTVSIAAALAASGAAPGTGSQSMVDAMTRMMDAFSDRWRWDSAPGGTHTDPWSSAYQWQSPGQAMPWGGVPTTPWGASPGMPWSQTIPAVPYAPGTAANLFGTWVADSGAVMLFDQSILRLYLSEDVSQDFEYRIAGNELLLRERRSGEIRSYRFAQLEDHMLLRDPGGNVLVLRRLRSRP